MEKAWNERKYLYLLNLFIKQRPKSRYAGSVRINAKEREKKEIKGRRAKKRKEVLE